MKLADQVVLLTGSNGDIGRALARDLAPECQRLLAVDLAPSAVTDADAEVSYYQCDLADHHEVKHLAARLDDDEPPVTVVVNAAGRIHSEPVVNLLDPEQGHHDPVTWRQVLASNLDTTFNVGTCFAERMARSRRGGLIVNISSVAASGNAGQSAYSAAKAAVNALTVTWAKELGVYRIRCVSIAPGFIDTPSTHQGLSEKHVARWVKGTPLRRLGSTAEVASAIRFVIENDFYTGRTIELDGGLRV
jgi:3-oxoacyl-[acyl-carrier protein] reductase